jgi:signal transduction histidine kinase
MRSYPTGRIKRSRRKRIFLFGLSVLLPALVLLVFIIRLNRQDIELRKTRAFEVKQQKAEEVGRLLADRLEEAERNLLRQLSSDPASIQTVYRTHPDLVFVGFIQNDEPLMPWQGSQAQKLFLGGGPSDKNILQAQQAEFEDNDLPHAKSLLNSALSSAASPSLKCSIQLQMGRILSKMGDEAGALNVYQEILDMPGDLTDEYGIPFVLFGAERLLISSSKVEPILSRMEGLVDEIRWLPSEALYFIQDIVDQIQQKTVDSVLVGKIESLKEGIADAKADLGRLESLKGIVSSWILRHRSLDQPADSLTWQSHSDIPWIIGIRDILEGQSQALFAFHGPQLLSAVMDESGLGDTFPGSCRMVVNSSEMGFSPGRAFEGFRLQFDETDVSAWTKSSLPFPILYWLILILVVGFTAFGGYLLWRDVSRELAIAEMRSHFAASVSHELKTPLTSIRMFAEALTMGVKKEPAAQKDYLQTIINESERLSRLLNNVLDFSKIEQGTRTYRLEATSLEEVIRAAQKAMAFPLNQKGFDLQVDMEKGIPEIFADKDALEQAVLNLLHNAMKYSGESREIQLRLRRNGDMVQIDVIDHGIGILEENKDRIFGKFFRVPGIENQKIPGTGLGLTIVSHIARSHGGRIEVKSQPGEGSTFSLFLPLEAE